MLDDEIDNYYQNKKEEHFRKKHSKRRRIRFRNRRTDAVVQISLARNVEVFIFRRVEKLITGLNFIKCNTLSV